MAVNLHEKYEKKIQSVFKEASLLTGRLSSDFSFKGAKTVKLTIPQTVPMVDYVRTGANRYGDPQEMQDLVQEMTLSEDKAFFASRHGRMISLAQARAGRQTASSVCSGE